MCPHDLSLTGPPPAQYCQAWVSANIHWHVLWLKSSNIIKSMSSKLNGCVAELEFYVGAVTYYSVLFQCRRLARGFKLSSVHVWCCWSATAYCQAWIKNATNVWSGKRWWDVYTFNQNDFPELWHQLFFCLTYLTLTFHHFKISYNFFCNYFETNTPVPFGWIWD